MRTVMTTTRLTAGGEAEWDAAMRARFDSAGEHAGWISGQILTSGDDPLTRVIVGTWQSREDREEWHSDPAFLDQRSTLERLEEEPSRAQWFDVVADARR